MSLEAAILENTATLRELIERLTNTTLAAPILTKGESNVVVTPKGEDLPVTKKKDPAKPAAAEKAVEAKGAAVEAGATEEIVDYKTVSQYILDLSKKDRKAVVGLLADYKAARGPDLKPEQYAAFCAQAKQLLAA